METTERRTTDGLGMGLAARCDGRLQPIRRVDDVARFTWEPAGDRWRWSTGMYALHGYAQRAVDPGLDVLLQHQHPQDRARTRDALMRIAQDGRPFVFEHRMVTEATGVRTVILSVTAAGGTDEPPQLIAGLLLDVTGTRRLHHAAEHDTIAGLQAELLRLTESSRARELIGQATGVLMERHKVTADEAGTMLRRASQIAGRKLLDVASELLYSGRLIGALPTPRAERLERG